MSSFTFSDLSKRQAALQAQARADTEQAAKSFQDALTYLKVAQGKQSTVHIPELPRFTYSTLEDIEYVTQEYKKVLRHALSNIPVATRQQVDKMYPDVWKELVVFLNSQYTQDQGNSLKPLIQIAKNEAIKKELFERKVQDYRRRAFYNEEYKATEEDVELFQELGYIPHLQKKEDKFQEGTLQPSTPVPRTSTQPTTRPRQGRQMEQSLLQNSKLFTDANQKYSMGSMIKSRLETGNATVTTLDNSAIESLTTVAQQKKSRIDAAIKNVGGALDSEDPIVLRLKAQKALKSGQEFQRNLNQVEYVDGMQKAFQKLFTLLEPYGKTQIGNIVIKQCNQMLEDFDRSMQIREVSKGGYEAAQKIAMTARISQQKQRQQAIIARQNSWNLFN